MSMQMQSYEILEDSTEQNLEDLGHRDDFLDATPKV